MADYLAHDVAETRKAVEAMLAAYPELAEDEELRADSLDGETSINAIMSRLVRYRNERKALADGMSGYLADLAERKARLLRGAEGLTKLMLSLMQSAQLPKLELPEATISVTKGRVKVDVTDVDALPQGTFTLSRTADKDAIKAQIEAGEDVPGARLVTGEPGISVRVK